MLPPRARLPVAIAGGVVALLGALLLGRAAIGEVVGYRLNLHYRRLPARTDVTALETRSPDGALGTLAVFGDPTEPGRLAPVQVLLVPMRCSGVFERSAVPGIWQAVRAHRFGLVASVDLSRQEDLRVTWSSGRLLHVTRACPECAVERFGQGRCVVVAYIREPPAPADPCLEPPTIAIGEPGDGCE